MIMETETSRVISWWSAGVASSVASGLSLSMYVEEADEVVIAYCDTSSAENPDNERFLTDCESWYKQTILRLKSSKYEDPWSVFEKTGWLIGPAGARCTTELKKKVRIAYQRPDDVHVFGFTLDETKRADRFLTNNPELDVRFPLIEKKLTHADCLALLAEQEIEIPVMYKMGYKNNNCLGCVKGGAGYWNKIRCDFPEVFERMATLERKMNVAMLKKQVKGERIRVFLDQLDPKAGRYQAEESVECGVGCNFVRNEINRAVDRQES